MARPGTERWSLDGLDVKKRATRLEDVVATKLDLMATRAAQRAGAGRTPFPLPLSEEALLNELDRDSDRFRHRERGDDHGLVWNEHGRVFNPFAFDQRLKVLQALYPVLGFGRVFAGQAAGFSDNEQREGADYNWRFLMHDGQEVRAEQLLKEATNKNGEGRDSVGGEGNETESILLSRRSSCVGVELVVPQ